MDDIKRALLGDWEAAIRLAKAKRAVPCPYCRGEPIAIRDGICAQAKCEMCGARGPRAASAFEAMIAWNTRAPILSAEEMERLEADNASAGSL